MYKNKFRFVPTREYSEPGPASNTNLLKNYMENKDQPMRGQYSEPGLASMPFVRDILKKSVT